MLEVITDSEDEAIALAAQQALEDLLLGDSNTQEVINEVLGIRDDEEEDFEFDLMDDFYEDPLEAEIRRLLDERDAW